MIREKKRAARVDLELDAILASLHAVDPAEGRADIEERHAAVQRANQTAQSLDGRNRLHFTGADPVGGVGVQRERADERQCQYRRKASMVHDKTPAHRNESWFAPRTCKLIAERSATIGFQNSGNGRPLQMPKGLPSLSGSSARGSMPIAL